MKHALLLLSLILCACQVQIETPTIIKFPKHYQPQQVERLLQSINYPELAKGVDVAVPGTLESKLSFFYRPLKLHGISGDSARMAVQVDVNAPSGWRKEAEVKKYLAEYLRK